MSLYRTVRSFIGRNFVRPFEDYCAVNRPDIYEFIFYNLRHKTTREDCGDAIFLHMNGYEDFTQLKREKDFALKIPLDFATEPVKLKLAAIVHIFYPELADELKNLLRNVPTNLDVYISTTSADKQAEIEKVFADFDGGRVTIKIFPNRGRDIAPMIVGFRDVFANYDACVHLHSKKSPHAEKRLSGWREHLYHNLLGSPEIVGGILEILSRENVGAVFPQYFDPIRVSINWGENFFTTQKFLRGLGIEIDSRHLVEFPAGSMFWFKPKAIAPILNCGLTFDDFPDESGQVDGTIAHAIERAFLFVVESAGFGWVKVDCGEKNFGMTPTLKSSSPAQLDENIFKARHSVLKRY